jgi:Arc/MetJ family transcription regulator
MRTNIVIEDKLMRDALRATRLKTKRVEWRGDLDALRSDH